MFCAITGCWLEGVANEFIQQLPMLQATVPSEKAVICPTLPKRVRWGIEPTMTSGSSPGSSHRLASEPATEAGVATTDTRIARTR